MSSYKFKNQNVVDISITFPEDETKAFIEGLRKLSGRPFFQAKYIGAALGVAITPGLKALRRTTPKGPTGNLKRAISKRLRRYYKQDFGWAVQLAGYRRTGEMKAPDDTQYKKAKDRAFHQGFIEFGTKRRKTRSFSLERPNQAVASSYKTIGPFALIRQADNKTIKTDPPYNPRRRAFFKAGKNGRAVEIAPTPAQHPIRQAFDLSIAQMTSRLKMAMVEKLNNAIKEFVLYQGPSKQKRGG